MAREGNSPLAGKRIVVTRTREQSEHLCRELDARGATVRIIPMISFAAAEDPAPLDAALCNLAQFDWLLLTSQNVVRALVQGCRSLGLAFPPPSGSMRIAAVGKGTAAAAEQAGWQITYISKRQQGLALADELAPQLAGRSVFLPRSALANPDLPGALRRYGARVTDVVAYRNLRPTPTGEGGFAEIARGDVDAILLFSPSAVRHLAICIGADRLRELQQRVTCAAIGPVTAGALREAGIERIVISREPTVSGILEALVEHWTQGAHTGVKQG